MVDFVNVGSSMLEYVVQLYNSFNIPGFSFSPWQFVLLGFQVAIIGFLYSIYLK